MKLHIENFAKISHADIEFDGLTVIAGDNNTGKSTVGKVLYAIFRSVSNSDRRIRNERLSSIQSAFGAVPGVDMFGSVIPMMSENRPIEEIVGAILERFWKAGESIGVKRPPVAECSKMIQTYSNMARPEIEQALRTSDADYGARIFLRVFDCVFHRQFHPLQSSEGVAKIMLTVKNEINTFSFGHAGWSRDCPTRLIKMARYVATPDVLSLVNVPDFAASDADVKYFDKYTYELVKELRRTEDRQPASQQIASTQALARIYGKLDSVIGGVFRRDEQNDLALFENGHSQPTKAANLSMGLKSFVLLRFMLERGILSDRDVLILDEPENHLHPEWQVVYAHTLILLQKAFHLTVLVTSHSQFFVNALQRLAISEGVAEDTHFYLSRVDDRRPGFCTFDDMRSLSGKIMRSFNRAYDRISEESGE